MADRPILFSAPMVRALLAGRKTQTRRMIKRKPALDALAVFGPAMLLQPGCVDLLRYTVGDRLWVREAFSVEALGPQRYQIDYRAGGTRDLESSDRWSDDLLTRLYDTQVGDWRTSIHMPRLASRLTLHVTDVRVQRLHDISEADAIAEGIEPGDTGLEWRCYAPEPKGQTHWACPCESYRTLWNSIHGAGSWASNPWVAAITFEVIKANIDSVKEGA